MRPARQSSRVRQQVLHLGDGAARRHHAAGDDLADTEQRNGQHDEVDPVEQPYLAEIEARDAVLRIDADRAEQQAGDAGDEPFHDGAADGGKRGEAQHDEREIFRRSERQRGVGERRSQQHETDRAQRAGEKGADGGNAQSDPARPCKAIW